MACITIAQGPSKDQHLQLSAFFRNCRYRLRNVRLGMPAGDKKPQSGRLLRYRWIKNGLDVDAASQQGVGEAGGFDRAADNRRDHREAAAVAGVDAGLAGVLQEAGGGVPVEGGELGHARRQLAEDVAGRVPGRGAAQLAQHPCRPTGGE